MATGASNLAAAQYDVFSVALVPKSSNIAYGHVVVFTSDANENKMVDIPTAATALLGGRAFAGISCGQGTTNTTYDNNIQVQRSGIAKCLLKASTACTRGGEAAYDPIDGGTVVPYTSANQVKIGEFRQSKASSASTQLVEVYLDAGSVFLPGLLGGIVADAAAAATIVDTEQTHTDATQTIKAGRLTAGSVIDIEGLAVVTGANAADTILFKLKLGSTAILTTIAYDAVANDIFKFKARVKIRTAGAAGTYVAMAEYSRAADGAAVGATVLDAVASTAIDTTAAQTISVTSTWSAANAANASVVRMLDVHISAAA